MQTFHYSTDKTAISVIIDGAACVVLTVSDTLIYCTTGKHLTSLQALVDVYVASSGKAKNVSGTWGNVHTEQPNCADRTRQTYIRWLLHRAAQFHTLSNK